MHARHWRMLTILGLALLLLFAASSWGKPQPPALPALPAIPPTPPTPVPSPNPNLAPPVPVPPPIVPSPLEDIKPKPTPHYIPPLAAIPAPPPVAFPAPAPEPQTPASPPEPEILEPVATIHWFTGKCLGNDNERVLAFTEKANGKAEVQSLSLAPRLPRLDGKVKDNTKCLEVPLGKAAYHAGRVFVATPRELLVITADCEIDWQFTLPGKVNNGEKLLDIVGFSDGKVLLASQQDSQQGQKATGRFYTLDVASGRQVAFATVPGGFDKDTRFAFNPTVKALFALSPQNVRAYELKGMTEAWKMALAAPTTHATAGAEGLFATLPSGIGVIHQTDFERILPGSAGTAAPAYSTMKNSSRLFVPTRDSANAYSLSAFSIYHINSRKLEWKLRLKHALATAPVLHGESVYFVAGNVLYRVNAATGAISWKHTLDPGAALTDLAFVDGELRASGPGVLICIAERAETPAPQPPAPKPDAPKPKPPEDVIPPPTIPTSPDS